MFGECTFIYIDLHPSPSSPKCHTLLDRHDMLTQMSPESLVKVLQSCVSNGGLNMSDFLLDTIKVLDEAPQIAWPMHHAYHPCWQQAGHGCG
eukprot:658525-Amphidinium_carterae.1